MANEKPQYASGYTSSQLELSKRTLLQVAVALGDYLNDVVLVGGLVPVLLIKQDEVAVGEDLHVGSIDVDLGLDFGIVSEERYDALTERLKKRGFEPDTNQAGNLTKQRWKFSSNPSSVVVDFLVDKTQSEEAEWGTIMHLTPELGAIRTLGLNLAFQDAVACQVNGQTLEGDSVTRTIPVCGPAAFIILKALAFRNRAEPKDAYDLGYVLHHFTDGPVAIAQRLMAFTDHPALNQALNVLREDFADETSIGPRSASRFLYTNIDPAYVADITGDITLLLRTIEKDSI